MRQIFEVIIIGGSYAGLAAAMALGRALKTVLIIDSHLPCNRQTPYSHNFLTQDGVPPKVIAELGRRQVENYDTIKFFDGVATSAIKTDSGFIIQVASGESFESRKIIFATGIRDILPDIHGFSECWGISVLHCPYCHGYEIRNQKTGIMGNGQIAFEVAMMISNWTQDLTVYTNGKSTLTDEQLVRLQNHQINIVDKEVVQLEHSKGYVQKIIFDDASSVSPMAIYAPCPFEQHCRIIETLGCELNDEGYIKIDAFHETTIYGIFACGDNVTRMRTVANAVAMGTTTGMSLSKKMILEAF
ncbi:MAG TPA: NAD(P)/FAD-dependent oxidoreductase [Flavitalea sp.]|nr:NAD(P)/FAD-dependent oxidoreductase [Flavitalea sp.]